tara:strand:+ start:1861 stop:2508 length:648 start_codon:yes stop_codon:yes gene_type:complete
MPSNRCQCFTRNNLVCKLKATFYLESKRYCHVHAKIIYNEKVTYIQKCYKGYKTRQKINIIFKPLPREIQTIILLHMREAHYLNLYNKSITNILCKKVEAIPKWINSTPDRLSYYEKFIYIYNLYSKYNSITTYEYDKILDNLSSKIWNLFNLQIRESQLFDNNGENIILQDNWSEIYTNLWTALTNYLNIYNEKYMQKDYIYRPQHIRLINYYN